MRKDVEDVRVGVPKAGKRQLFDGYHIELENTSIIDINSDGYRDELYSTEKPANTKRFIALGDSTTFGWGVNESDRWTEVLNRRLNNMSKVNYQVINLGVYAYNTSMEVEMLKEKGLKYNPDAVIVQYHRNDATNATRQERLLEKYEERIKEKYSDSNITARELEVKIQRKVYQISKEKRSSMPVEESMAVVEPPLSRLVNMSERNNFRVYIVGWPVNEKQSAHLEKLSERYNFTYVNMQSTLDTYYSLGEPYENPYMVLDGHPSSKGHKLLAEGILDTVNRTKFLRK